MVRPMEIAVTGAYGHLGVNLTRQLVANGHSVRAVDIRQTAALDGLGIDHVEADVLNRSQIESAFDGVETVFHLAARISVVGDPDGSVWRTNVDGAATAARAALARGVKRYVHVSSVHALDFANARPPITEDAPTAIRKSAPAYDRSKAMAERFVLDLVDEGLDAVIVRPTAIIGPDDHDISRMGALFRALGGGDLPLLVRGGFDWVDVRDVVNGMVSAAERADTGRTYLLGGSFATVKELATMVAAVTGARRPMFEVPLGLARLIGGPATWFARRTGNPLSPTSEALRALRNGKPVDSSLARKELDYTTRPLEETVRDIYVWLDESGLSS